MYYEFHSKFMLNRQFFKVADVFYLLVRENIRWFSLVRIYGTNKIVVSILICYIERTLQRYFTVENVQFSKWTHAWWWTDRETQVYLNLMNFMSFVYKWHNVILIAILLVLVRQRYNYDNYENVLNWCERFLRGDFETKNIRFLQIFINVIY